MPDVRDARVRKRETSVYRIHRIQQKPGRLGREPGRHVEAEGKPNKNSKKGGAKSQFLY